MKSAGMKVQNSLNADADGVFRFDSELEKREHRRWKADEKEKLRTLWLSGMEIETIAEKLDRTYAMVAVKAHRMDLPKRKARPRDQQFLPIAETSEFTILVETSPQPVKKRLPRCLGPCDAEFTPQHKFQRVCLRCRKALRQMAFF